MSDLNSDEGAFRWFGKSWGAPICEDIPHAPTPASASCARCPRPIKADDQGFLVPRTVRPVEELGEGYWMAVFDVYHRDCLVAALTGGRANG